MAVREGHHFAGRDRQQGHGRFLGGLAQEVSRLLIRFRQGCHVCSEVRVPSAGFVEECAAFSGRALEHLVEQGLNPLPAHGVRRQIRLHPSTL